MLIFLYILNATILLLHEIESGYEKEWEILKLPGKITGFVLLHIPVLFIGSSGYMVEGKRFNFPRWKRIAVLNLSRFLNPHAILLIR